MTDTPGQIVLDLIHDVHWIEEHDGKVNEGGHRERRLVEEYSAKIEARTARLAAYEDFPAFLRLLATKHSLRSIAFASGVDHATLSRLVRFDRDPLMSTVKKVIEAYT